MGYVIIAIICLGVGGFLGAFAERVASGYDMPKDEDRYF